MSITLFKLLIPLQKDRFQKSKIKLLCGCKKNKRPPQIRAPFKFNKRPSAYSRHYGIIYLYDLYIYIYYSKVLVVHDFVNDLLFVRIHVFENETLILK